MDIDTISKNYEQLADDELAEIARGEYDLTQAILTGHPEMSQDAGFELFDTEWAKRYWRNIVAEIQGTNVLNVTYDWAVNATVTGTATLIANSFGVPAVALGACVALAILLIRAARSSEADEKQVGE